MAREYRTIDIWVGSFSSESALKNYLLETDSDDDTAPISQLASDMGVHFYDHDFIERSFHEPLSVDLSSRLASHSFSASYVGAATAAFELASCPDFNTLLLVWNKQFDPPHSVDGADYRLRYLGRFACDPDA